MSKQMTEWNVPKTVGEVWTPEAGKARTVVKLQVHGSGEPQIVYKTDVKNAKERVCNDWSWHLWAQKNKPIITHR